MGTNTLSNCVGASRGRVQGRSPAFWADGPYVASGVRSPLNGSEPD